MPQSHLMVNRRKPYSIEKRERNKSKRLILSMAFCSEKKIKKLRISRLNFSFTSIDSFYLFVKYFLLRISSFHLMEYLISLCLPLIFRAKIYSLNKAILYTNYDYFENFLNHTNNISNTYLFS